MAGDESAATSKRPTWVKVLMVVGGLWVAGLAFQAIDISQDGPLVASLEKRYVDFIREEVPGSASKSDAEIIAGGERICRELKGKTQDEILGLAVILGVDQDEFAAALVGSVRTFCPQYRHLLET